MLPRYIRPYASLQGTLLSPAGHHCLHSRTCHLLGSESYFSANLDSSDSNVATTAAEMDSETIRYWDRVIDKDSVRVVAAIRDRVQKLVRT